MNKIVCVYHNIDLDGFMSAAIVKHWFKKQYPNSCYYNVNTQEAAITPPDIEGSGNSLDFIGYNYGQPIPDLSEYDKVIMCDISFPLEDMLDLGRKLSMNFVYIDHHISAIVPIEEELRNTNTFAISGLRDTKFAACELTWLNFFNSTSMPEIVRLLGRYDCFGHKTKSFEMSSDGYDKAKQYLKEVGQLKEFEDNHTSIDGYSLVHYANDVAKQLSEEQKVLEFQYGARQHICSYEEAYSKLIHNIKYPNDIINCILSDGKSIYQYLCTEAKQSYKNGFEVLLNEPFNVGAQIQSNLRRFIAINKERFNPINFGIDYHKDGYNGVASFYFDGIYYNFSLYNNNGLVDCSVIAKQFGGGGHKGAAGFRLTKEDFNELIK